MGYVYKIQGDFNETNFEDIIEELSKKFFFMYVEDTLFVAIKNFKDDNKSKNIISKIIHNNNDDDDFAIIEITRKNIDRLNDVAKEWCLNNLVRIDTDRYESEHQEDLKSYWIAMNKMEEELSKQLEERNKENKENNENKERRDN